MTGGSCPTLAAMTSSTTNPPISTVERAADVLNAFTEADGATLGVTEIAQLLGLSKAVVHRILSSLANKRFVEVDDVTRRYSLGPAALSLGLTYLQSIDLRDLVRPVLRELSDETAETATMSIRRGMHRMYIDQFTPSREVKMTVHLGHPYPLHAGSSSKVFLAFSTKSEQEQYLDEELNALTPMTVTDAHQLRNDLDLIRERGYASSQGERQTGAASLAAPIFDHTGGVAAVVSVCGPRERFVPETERFLPSLLAATGRLSDQLGASRSSL